jgi:hypothetical protein
MGGATTTNNSTFVSLEKGTIVSTFQCPTLFLL